MVIVKWEDLAREDDVSKKSTYSICIVVRVRSRWGACWRGEFFAYSLRRLCGALTPRRVAIFADAGGLVPPVDVCGCMSSNVRHVYVCVCRFVSSDNYLPFGP